MSAASQEMRSHFVPTWRVLTGLVLIVGSVLFIGIANLTLAIGPPAGLTDGQGTPIYLLPPQAALDVVSRHQALWWWTNTFFIVGNLVTLLGLTLLSLQCRQAGDPILSQLGLILFVMGAMLWVVQRAIPLSIDSLASHDLARTGMLPDYYLALTRWAQALFALYCVFAYGAFIAYGGAILFTRVLPRWLGWLAIGDGLFGLGLTGLSAGAIPGPWFQYVLPLLMGSVLLLGRAPDATAVSGQPTPGTDG